MIDVAAVLPSGAVRLSALSTGQRVHGHVYVRTGRWPARLTHKNVLAVCSHVQSCQPCVLPCSATRTKHAAAQSLVQPHVEAEPSQAETV